MSNPFFQMPFRCGEEWRAELHHDGHPYKLDFNRDDDFGRDVLASAGGTVSASREYPKAGEYILIDHGGGWETEYMHLKVRSVQQGQHVDQGQKVGEVGHTGNARPEGRAGTHLHYEQIHNGTTVRSVFNGVPMELGEWLTSHNCDGEQPGADRFPTWGTNVNIRQEPTTNSAVVGSLAGSTRVRVDCQVRGEKVTAEGITNEWWAHLPDYGGYMTNIYVDVAPNKIPGVPTCSS